MSTLPNYFPPVSNRIALVGECPSEQDLQAKKPFMGMAGQFLDKFLRLAGINRDQCFLGHVSQHYPGKNKDLSSLPLDGEEIQQGLAQLKADLSTFSPNLVVLLGRYPLWAAKGVWNLSDWRGSLFVSELLKSSSGEGLKCLASYPPSYCLRQYEGTPLLLLDLKRAAVEGKSPLLELPQRDLVINQPAEFYLNFLDYLETKQATVACDIEGYVYQISCISFATSPTYSVTIPFFDVHGNPAWDPSIQTLLFDAVSRVLRNPEVKKVWQNGLYDRFVWLRHGVEILGNLDDTMLKFWEYQHEFEKSLGFQASILTREPYYKMERKTQDNDTYYRYCARDSAVTHEINTKLSPLLTPTQTSHYRFNHDLLSPLLYIQNRGFRYNEALASERLLSISQHVYGWQFKLDEIARSLSALESGLDFSKENAEILAYVQTQVCKVKRTKGEKSFLLDQPKKEFIYEYPTWLARLSSPTPLTDTERGQLSMWIGETMNTKSHKKFQEFLYKTCGLPTQYKKDPSTKEFKVTTDYFSLLKLSKSHSHPALGIALELSRLRTRMQMLRMPCFEGRIYASYNIVGTETSRVSCSKSNLYVEGKKVGNNLQTIPDDWPMDEDHPLTQGMRDLFIADEGCLLAKMDLKGADGWTIGAYLASLGDPTMLDDLKAGIKPAQIVAYMLMHGTTEVQQNFHNRDVLLKLCKTVKKDAWQYFVSKVLIWGGFYRQGARAAADQVFLQSDGAVTFTERQAKEFHELIQVRYKFRRYQDHFKDLLTRQGYPAQIACSDGSVRKFWGRNHYEKCEILGEALAHPCQVHTTHVIKKAVHNLWFDPDNWNGETPSVLKRPRAEVYHLVHDELVLHFRAEDKEWLKNKLPIWFNNPIIIANQTILIPYSGAIGTAWSMSGEHLVEEL